MADKTPKATIERKATKAVQDGAHESDQAVVDKGASGEGQEKKRFSPRAWLSSTFPGHENAVVGGIAGLLLALLIFIIGPLNAVIVALFVTVGVAVGQIVDGDPKIIRAIRSLFDNA